MKVVEKLPANEAEALAVLNYAEQVCRGFVFADSDKGPKACAEGDVIPFKRGG